MTLLNKKSKTKAHAALTMFDMEAGSQREIDSL
jgi:hypothetical protein